MMNPFLFTFANFIVKKGEKYCSSHYIIHMVLGSLCKGEWFS